MKIKDCDLLSQKIYLYFQGKKRHSSNFSAALSLLMIFLCSFYIFYLLTDIFLHKSISFFSFKKYVKDVSYFPFNYEKNGIFHYFQFVSNKKNATAFNKKYIRIFMSRIHQGYFNNYKNLNVTEHWVYDLCREGIDDKNVPKEVFESGTNISGGACLRYYYNIEDKKYYSINDKKNFKYPYLEHGISSNQNQLLNSNIEKCNNDSILSEILGPCGDANKMEDYINSLPGLYFQLLENQINTDNYSNPLLSFINGIPGSFDNLNVPINNIYLSPYNIDLQKGTLFPSYTKISTYTLNTNDKYYWYNYNKRGNLLAVYSYWLQNFSQEIKGGYVTLYDILPNIGGMIKFIFYVFFSINYFFNKFVVFQDSADLYWKIAEQKFNRDKQKDIYEFTKVVNELRKENKKYSYSSNYMNSNSLSINNSSINNVNNNISAIRSINPKIYETKSPQFFGQNKILENEKQIYNNNFKSNKLVRKNNILKNIYNNNPSLPTKNKNDIFNNLEKQPQRIESQNFGNFNAIKFGQNNNRSNVNNIEISRRKFGSTNLYRKNSLDIFSGNLENFLVFKKRDIKLEPMAGSYLAKHISFYYYLSSLFWKKGKKGRSFNILNKFRKKLLSEEHIFRAHVFLYYLEKYFDIEETQKVDITELYSYL